MELVKEVKPPRQFKNAKSLRFGHDEHGRTCAWQTCSTCKTAEGVVVKLEAPPIALEQSFQKLGWVKGTCPKCQASGKTPTPVSVSPAQQRQVFRLLEEQLTVDRSFGEFRPGWSDARIAEAAGVDEAYVAEARRAGFAPHLMDRAREELLAQLVELRAESTREMKELHDIIDDAHAKFETELAKLREQLETR